MLIALVSFLFFLCAGAYWGVMDLIQFHFDKSIFSKKDRLYWDPSASWANKWKWVDVNGKQVRKEKFWGSSRWFVRFTDGWHRMKSYTLLSIVLSSWTQALLPLLGLETIWWAQMLSPIGLWCGFWITYESKLLRL